MENELRHAGLLGCWFASQERREGPRVARGAPVLGEAEASAAATAYNGGGSVRAKRPRLQENLNRNSLL